MNARLAAWGLFGLTLLVGCVPSLNPVATEKQLVFDQNVLGVWGQTNAEDRWEFTKGEGNAYRLLYTDKEGHQGRFIAQLAEIEGARFLDLFPEEAESDASGFYKFHLVPIHTVYLVKQTEPNVQLAAIDYKWLGQYLTDHPGAVQSATFNGRKMLTGPTEEVQRFVLEHQDMFTGEFTLVRQNTATN
jgi:hypothetical protein